MSTQREPQSESPHPDEPVVHNLTPGWDLFAVEIILIIVVITFVIVSNFGLMTVLAVAVGLGIVVQLFGSNGHEYQYLITSERIISKRRFAWWRSTQVRQVRMVDIADVSTEARTREALVGRGTVVISPKYDRDVLKLYECRDHETVAASIREIVETKQG